MLSLSSKNPNPQSSKLGFRARPDGALETLDGAELQIAEGAGNFHLATGPDARRLYAELAELRELRLKAAGGYVFKRERSPYWQIKYRVGGKWRHESSHTENKRDANALLTEKVFHASAGTLPGTASFEQAIELLLNDARVRGLKSLSRLERAGRPLLAQFEGLRVKDITRSALVKYAADRQRQDCAPDSVKFELDVLHRALKLAQREGWITVLPDFPRIAHLHVRAGFFDPHEWSQVREHLRPDFRDAADFAFLTGWREMEVLGLKWSDVNLRTGEVRLDAGSTKSGAGRVLPFSYDSRLTRLIERREAIKKRLAMASVISPWVFCFEQPLRVRGRTYHAAGAPLFRPDRDRGLPTALREEWSAACAATGLPGRMFHDLRRSAARNFERAGIPRSVARKLGGWSDKIYSRYAIGADSELGAAVGQAAEYVARAGWHSGSTEAKSSMKPREKLAEGGGSRTLRRQY